MNKFSHLKYLFLEKILPQNRNLTSFTKNFDQNHEIMHNFLYQTLATKQHQHVTTVLLAKLGYKKLFFKTS